MYQDVVSLLYSMNIHVYGNHQLDSIKKEKQLISLAANITVIARTLYDIYTEVINGNKKYQNK